MSKRTNACASARSLTSCSRTTTGCAAATATSAGSEHERDHDGHERAAARAGSERSAADALGAALGEQERDERRGRGEHEDRVERRQERHAEDARASVAAALLSGAAAAAEAVAAACVAAELALAGPLQAQHELEVLLRVGVRRVDRDRQLEVLRRAREDLRDRVLSSPGAGVVTTSTPSRFAASERSLRARRGARSAPWSCSCADARSVGVSCAPRGCCRCG